MINESTKKISLADLMKDEEDESDALPAENSIALTHQINDQISSEKQIKSEPISEFPIKRKRHVFGASEVETVIIEPETAQKTEKLEAVKIEPVIQTPAPEVDTKEETKNKSLNSFLVKKNKKQENNDSGDVNLSTTIESSVQDNIDQNDQKIVSESTLLTPSQKPKKSLKELKNTESEAKASGFDFKITLATLKAYVPLLAAATFSPGIEGNGGDVGKAVSVMAFKTTEMTEKLCHLVGVSMKDTNDQWKVSQLREICSDYIALRWKTNAFEDANFNEDSALEALLVLNNSAKSYPDKFSFPYMSDTTRLQFSAMKSIMPVIKEINFIESYMHGLFKGYQIKREPIEQIAELLLNHSVQFVEMINDIPGDENAKLIMVQALLNHSGIIYAHAIQYQADAMMNHANSLTPEKAQAYLLEISKKNPLMVDLEVVNKEFLRQFSFLTKTVKVIPKLYAETTSFVEPNNVKRKF